MVIKFSHPWDVSPQEAIAIQKQLYEKVERRDRFGDLRIIAGVDVGFEEDGRVTRAAVAAFRFPELSPLYSAVARRPTTFPYIPGLLSFREVPTILDAIGKLAGQPDLYLCDGQGLAHPRRFGLACHLGVLIDRPTIGVGKSRLIGDFAPLGAERGAREWLLDRGQTIGMVLRTRTNVKPLFISIGHRVSLETAVDYVLRCGGKFRLPEPIRQAHLLASKK